MQIRSSTFTVVLVLKSVWRPLWVPKVEQLINGLLFERFFAFEKKVYLFQISSKFRFWSDRLFFKFGLIFDFEKREEKTISGFEGRENSVRIKALSSKLFSDKALSARLRKLTKLTKQLNRDYNHWIIVKIAIKIGNF